MVGVLVRAVQVVELEPDLGCPGPTIEGLGSGTDKSLADDASEVVRRSRVRRTAGEKECDRQKE